MLIIYTFNHVKHMKELKCEYLLAVSRKINSRVR